MATSGTAVYNLDIIDIIDEAYDRCGLEARTSYDFKTAKRSLDLLFMEWGNRGLNQWTVEERALQLQAGQETYELPADVIDIMEHSTSKGGFDTPLTKISLPRYAAIGAKGERGTPNVITIIRKTETPVIKLWPVPAEDMTLVYWCIRRIHDTGDADNNVDVPTRFLPALIADLAVKLGTKLAAKNPQVAAVLPNLQAEAARLFMEAADEDKDKSNYFIRPRFRF